MAIKIGKRRSGRCVCDKRAIKSRLSREDAVDIIGRAKDLAEAITLLGRLPVLFGKSADIMTLHLPEKLVLKVEAGQNLGMGASSAWNDLTFSKNGQTIDRDAALAQLRHLQPKQFANFVKAGLSQIRQ